MSNNPGWLVAGAKRDAQSITSDWDYTGQRLIEGVRLKEIRNVPKGNGFLTEIWRREWDLDALGVDQVFQVHLRPGGISAWHAHEITTDRLFVGDGILRIVLYDAREDSPTYGLVNEFRLGAVRPGLVIVPPKIWHGVQNIGNESGVIINLVDQAYHYENPDHWRVPMDSPDIPYRFPVDSF